MIQNHYHIRQSCYFQHNLEYENSYLIGRERCQRNKSDIRHKQFGNAVQCKSPESLSRMYHTKRFPFFISTMKILLITNEVGEAYLIRKYTKEQHRKVPNKSTYLNHTKFCNTYFNFPVKSSRSSQCRLNTIRPICCSNYNHSISSVNTIHQI